jgi:hypothetical protein
MRCHKLSRMKFNHGRAHALGKRKLAMNRNLVCVLATLICSESLVACGDSGTSESRPSTGGSSGSGQGGTGGGTGGTSAATGGTTSSGSGGSSAGTGGTGGSTTAPGCDQILALAQAYKAAHPTGSDYDILAKSPAQIAADPAAQELLSICGEGQLPVIPILAWEYGGNNHPWINPEASAVAYCVYIPANPSTEHWQYDATADHVTADVYVKCPELNPCNGETGANQVMNCLGDPTNIEILVDIASLNDGVDVGLMLSEASTDLNLILTNGTKVHLYTGL